MDVRGANGCRMWPVKNKSKSDFLMHLMMYKGANGTTINAFEADLKMQLRLHLIKQVELHPKIHFKIHIKIQKKMHSRLH